MPSAMSARRPASIEMTSAELASNASARRLFVIAGTLPEHRAQAQYQKDGNHSENDYIDKRHGIPQRDDLFPPQSLLQCGLQAYICCRESSNRLTMNFSGNFPKWARTTCHLLSNRVFPLDLSKSRRLWRFIAVGVADAIGIFVTGMIGAFVGVAALPANCSRSGARRSTRGVPRGRCVQPGAIPMLIPVSHRCSRADPVSSGDPDTCSGDPERSRRGAVSDAGRHALRRRVQLRVPVRHRSPRTDRRMGPRRTADRRF